MKILISLQVSIVEAADAAATSCAKVSSQFYAVGLTCPVPSQDARSVIQQNNESHQFTQLRDWLVPMLMNGQVRVA